MRILQEGGRTKSPLGVLGIEPTLGGLVSCEEGFVAKALQRIEPFSPMIEGKLQRVCCDVPKCRRRAMYRLTRALPKTVGDVMVGGKKVGKGEMQFWAPIRVLCAEHAVDWRDGNNA